MTTNRDVCSHYEPKDGVVAILREAARNLSDYHAGEALCQLTDTWNVCHALETLADMVERDYVRRESIEEVMNNDRALVEENSMLAGELLKLRAELEKATNNLNSANKDFENARAELTVERDKLKELNEYHALQYELASEDADRLQAQVDGLRSKLAEYEGRSMTRADRLLEELNNDRRINKQLKMANALLRKSETAKIERIEQLESLVRDMWHEMATCPEYATPPCMNCNICAQICNLGVEVGESVRCRDCMRWWNEQLRKAVRNG